MTAPIRPEIKDGARYFDDPQYAVYKPLAECITPVALGIAEGYRPPDPSPISGMLSYVPVPKPISELTGYQKVRLRWMMPDGKGGLTPRARQKKKYKFTGEPRA